MQQADPRVPLWKQLRAIAALPAVVTVVAPALLLVRDGAAAPGGGLAPPWSALLPLAGLALIGLGLWLVARTIALFHALGRGTLAPWNPPRRLVVAGVYRRVRNPMISGVLAILLGESLLFASPALGLWFLVFALVNSIYIPLAEEPSLERRFGEPYARYRRNVPRWIPRSRPWTGEDG